MITRNSGLYELNWRSNANEKHIVTRDEKAVTSDESRMTRNEWKKMIKCIFFVKSVSFYKISTLPGLRGFAWSRAQSEESIAQRAPVK